MDTLILNGPRCCGKTSIGKLVANRLEIPFYDADNVFVEANGSVADYVKQYDWPGFRKEESRILGLIASSAGDKPIILALGGGALVHDQGEEHRQANVKLMRSLGKTVYILPNQDLEISTRILTERMLADSTSDDQRPSLTGESDEYREMLIILKKRHKLYMDTSDITIHTGEQTIEQVAEQIYNLSIKS